MNQDLLELVIRELVAALEPLRMAATDPQARHRLLARIGWRADKLDPGGLTALFDGIPSLLDELRVLAETLSQGPPSDLFELTAVLTDLADVLDRIRALKSALSGVGAPPRIDDLVPDLIERLVLDRLQARPPLAAALRTLGLVVVEGTPSFPPADAAHWDVRRPRLRLDRLPDVLADPMGAVVDQIAPDGWGTQHAEAVIQRIYRLLTLLLARTCADVRKGLPQLPDLDLTAPDWVDIARRTILIEWVYEQAAGVLTLGLSPPDAGDLGLVFNTWGRVDAQERLGDWLFTLGLEADAGTIAVKPDQVAFDGPGRRARFDMSVEYAPEEGQPRFQLGGGAASVTIGSPKVSMFGDLVAGSPDFGVSLSLGEVIVAVKGGDGFISRLLPDDGLTVEAQLTLGWTQQRGLVLSGSAGLTTQIDVHKRLGPVVISTVDIALTPTSGALRLTAAPSFGGKLGPLAVVVEGMGVAVDIALQPGNLGPIDLGGLSLTAPTGLGLALDAGPVSGGGFLRRDPALGRYQGAMTVRFGEIVVSAVGLFETGDPPSLVVILSGEFPPIALGFGFMLTGVGGALGFHRTIDTDVLRNGVRDGTLGSLMFPEDPVANAPAILADIARVFPRREGQHVFGPIVRLAWGQPAMIEATLGLVLELPSPIRLAMLGRLRIGLPTLDAPLVDLRIDAVGLIDFGERLASLDAALVDSHVLGLTVEGELALRLGWGSRPGFVFAIGGFHPRFEPPPGVPDLQRCAISVGHGGNPRIRVEGYLAVTSNSAQFGAKAELYASFGVTVNGMLSFDALFIFSPFSFTIDMRARLALSAFGINLLSIGVSLTLSGPAPWRARGTARIDVLFLTVKVGFDVKVGERRDEQLPSTDVWPPLRAAIANPESWTARLVGNDALGMVETRQLPPEEAARVAHPLGGLSFRQQVAPFGLDLERFGSAEPAGARRFDIDDVVIEDDTGAVASVAADEVREPFAPGQFLELNEEERLSRPSFESMQAGRSVAGIDDWELGNSLPSPFAFEQSVIDEETKRGVSMGPGTLPDAMLDAMTAFAAAGSGALSAAFAAPALAVAFTDERYQLIDRRTAETIAVEGQQTWPSQAEARQAKARAEASNPNLHGQVVVSPAFERAA